MKTPAKVFIWIGMIIQFFLIYPIVLGVLSLKKINSATSSNELQTLGIFTTLFCSLLGGVFMLCIKDDELNGAISASNNGVVVYKKKHITYEENCDIDPSKLKAKKTIKILLYTLIGVLAISLLFSIAATEEYNGGSYIPLIFVGTQILLYIVLMVFFIIKKHTLTNITNALLISFGVVSAAEIAMSCVTNYSLAWTYEWYNGYNYHVYGAGWEYWVLYALAIVCVAVTVIALYFSFKTHQKNFVGASVLIKKVSYTSTSNVEIELAEAQRLLDNGIINNEEYQSVRKGILNKYYNADI